MEVGGLLVPELITDMPTFFDYDETTGDMILDGSGNPAKIMNAIPIINGIEKTKPWWEDFKKLDFTKIDELFV